MATIEIDYDVRTTKFSLMLSQREIMQIVEMYKSGVFTKMLDGKPLSRVLYHLIIGDSSDETNLAVIDNGLRDYIVLYGVEVPGSNNPTCIAAVDWQELF